MNVMYAEAYIAMNFSDTFQLLHQFLPSVPHVTLSKMHRLVRCANCSHLSLMNS